MRPVKVGDTVGFYLSDVFTRGIVMAVYKEESTWMVKVCPVRKWSYLRLLQEMWMSLPPPHPTPPLHFESTALFCSLQSVTCFRLHVKSATEEKNLNQGWPNSLTF